MKVKYLTDFTCQPHYPYTLFLGNSVETGTQLMGIFSPIPITVPESIYTALERAGIIEDPLIKMNSLKAEWVAERWWLYQTEFDGEKSEFCKITFGAVDYHCHVYLNGQKVCEHVGASAPFTVDVSGKVAEGKNLLRVIVENVPNENGQIGYTNRTFTQRPRFDNKWDFCFRLKNIGIYRPVTVCFYDGASIEAVGFHTLDYSTRHCKITALLNAERAGEYTLEGKIKNGEDVLCSFEKQLLLEEGESSISHELRIERAEPWNPNGIGAANVYTLELCVKKGTNCLYRTAQTVGIREIKLLKNEGAEGDCRGYTFCVNGKKFFAKGFNITPLRQLLGSETDEDYERLVLAARDAGANVIRVWGGGVIEQELFYELCSRHGLMVWQDMIQSSSGLNSEPAESEELLSLLSETVRFTMEHRAQYPCTAVICGGNELFGGDGRPVTEDNKNVALIKNIVKKYYPETEFISSTSSGPTQEADLENYKNNHDVHGPWLYLGNDGHYRHYNRLKTMFVGEFGCNGMCSLSSAERFMSSENLVPTTCVQNDEWRHHGEWWDNGFWARELFGELTFKELNTVSRYLQAVGLEYGVRSLRRGWPYTSGCMLWQLNEMAPQLSLTSLIDYYGDKKPAYFAVKRAFSKICPSMKFDKMMHDAGEEFEVEFYISSDEKEELVTVELEERMGESVERSVILSGKTSDRATLIAAKKYALSGEPLHLKMRAITKEKEYTTEFLFVVRDGQFCNKRAIKIMEDINEGLF